MRRTYEREDIQINVVLYEGYFNETFIKILSCHSQITTLAIQTGKRFPVSRGSSMQMQRCHLGKMHKEDRANSPCVEKKLYQVL